MLRHSGDPRLARRVGKARPKQATSHRGLLLGATMRRTLLRVLSDGRARTTREIAAETPWSTRTCRTQLDQLQRERKITHSQQQAHRQILWRLRTLPALGPE